METNSRPWADLPSELVSQISDRLGLLDLLRFRSVCRQWNLSSSISTAESESSPGRSPGFLVYGEGSWCRWTSEAGENFALDMPELGGGAICLASSHGWLLVLQNEDGSVFFLCPFSRARIDLPRLDWSEELAKSDHRHVAAFSAPPPSLDCVVAVVRRKSPVRLGLDLIRRGEESWSALEFIVTVPRTVSCGAHHGGKFYFFDRDNGVAIFSINDRSLKPYRIVNRSENKENTKTETIPFGYNKDYLKSTNKRAEIPEDASISTCGTFVGTDVLFNEDIEPLGEEESSAASRRLKGVWLHPRFFRFSKDEMIAW